MKIHRISSKNPGLKSGTMRSVSTTAAPRTSIKPAWIVLGSASALGAALTVFSSARVMVSAHELAQLHAAQSEMRQELRFLQTEYATVSSLDHVAVYAEQAGLTQMAQVQGTLNLTTPVAQNLQ